MTSKDVVITFRATHEQQAKLNTIAGATGESVSAILRRMLDEQLPVEVANLNLAKVRAQLIARQAQELAELDSVISTLSS